MSDPDAPAMNFRSASYSIAIELERCPRCSATTLVVALCLPAGHERLENGDETALGAESEPTWEGCDGAAMIFYVAHLPQAVVDRLQAFSAGYRRGFSSALQSAYWANHCAACDALLEDHDLHCEPEGAFTGAFAQPEARERWPWLDEPLQAAAGGCSADPLA